MHMAATYFVWRGAQAKCGGWKWLLGAVALHLTLNVLLTSYLAAGLATLAAG